MSANLPVPKCRIEVFRKPGFFDDDWKKGWSLVSGGTSGWSNQDPDKVIVGAGDQTDGIIEHTLNNIDTNIYTKLEVRVLLATNFWNVYVYDGSSWIMVWATNQTALGLSEASLPVGKTLTKIRIFSVGTGSETWYDYVVICKNPFLTPVTEDLNTKDVLETLETTSPILSRGLGGTKFKLPNFSAQYTGAIHEHDVVLVWLYRTGETFKKLFGGRISKLSYEGIAGAPEYYIHVELMDHGDEMQVPPSLLQKAYTSTNGKTIIKDAVALCNYLSDYGVDTSNAIASTHSYVFDEKTPWNVVRDVADACQTSGGAVGFDGYVDAPGNLWIFPRNSSNSTVDLSDKILRYKIDYDTYRVKNKIKVYGKDERPWSGTVSVDGWTESTTGWSSDGTLSADNIDKVEGSYSLKTVKTGSVDVYVQRSFSAIYCLYPKEYKSLKFAWNYDSPRAQSDCKPHLDVYLLAPDWSNYFVHGFNYEYNKEKNKWEEMDIRLNEESSEYYMAWKKVGSASWSNIQQIRLNLFLVGSGTEGITFRIDRLHFYGARFSGEASDSASQGLYGVRMPEPIVDDSLTSDDDCTKKAQSLLAYYKDKVTTLTITTFGDNNFKPGDKQPVVLSNDNINDYFRILEVRHTLQDVYWQTELLMSNEPVMIDYIFRKMFEAQKTLQTNI